MKDLPRRVHSWLGRLESEGKTAAVAEACEKKYKIGWGVRELPNVKPGHEVAAVIGYLTKVAENAQKTLSLHTTFHLTNSHGEPITDPQARLEAILAGGWTTDPDPGHAWSIPNEQTARGAHDTTP